MENQNSSFKQNLPTSPFLDMSADVCTNTEEKHSEMLETSNKLGDYNSVVNTNASLYTPANEIVDESSSYVSDTSSEYVLTENSESSATSSGTKVSPPIRSTFSLKSDDLLESLPTSSSNFQRMNAPPLLSETNKIKILSDVQIAIGSSSHNSSLSVGMILVSY